MISCRSLFGLNLCVILTRKKKPTKENRNIHSFKTAFIPGQMKLILNSFLTTIQPVYKNDTLLSVICFYWEIRIRIFEFFIMIL